jgi:hypothetical protein
MSPVRARSPAPVSQKSLLKRTFRIGDRKCRIPLSRQTFTRTRFESLRVRRSGSFAVVLRKSRSTPSVCQSFLAFYESLLGRDANSEVEVGSVIGPHLSHHDFGETGTDVGMWSPTSMTSVVANRRPLAIRHAIRIGLTKTRPARRCPRTHQPGPAVALRLARQLRVSSGLHRIKRRPHQFLDRSANHGLDETCN